MPPYLLGIAWSGWNETLSIRSVGFWHRRDIGSPVISLILGLLAFAVHHGTLSLEGSAVWTGWTSLLCTFCSVSVHGFPTSEPGEIWTLTLRISFCHQLTAWVCCSLVYIVCVPITPLCGRPFQFQILLPLMWVVLSCCPVTVYNLLVVHLQVASEIWDPLDTLLHICRGPALFLPLVQSSPFHKSLIILF